MSASATAAITIAGDLAAVGFGRYDLETYRLFLRCKSLPESRLAYDWQADAYTLTTPARFAPLLGAATAVDPPAPLPLAEHLFDYQRWCVAQALDARRFALWLDTGLGKTAVALEWARQVCHLTGGRVLILTPPAVIRQWQEEAERFYGAAPPFPLDQVPTRAALAAWCEQPGAAIGISNYEKFIPGLLPELRGLAGLVADEASILKTGAGTIKWNLSKSARGIPYKLACTATPAPNEVMEFASQAGFLEKLRTEQDVLWTFFRRDKRGTWHVRPHARAAFYRFMASWSIFLRDPARFGFGDILASLPPPEVREYRLEMTPAQREWRLGFLVEQRRGFFDDRLGVKQRSKLSQLGKGFLYDTGGRTAARIASLKPAFVADLARADLADGRQVIIWTVFDEEAAILAEQLADVPGVGMLHGDLGEPARAETIERFRRGELGILITKAALVGFGLNFQHCRSMIFSGFDDSFERLYQAVRRCVRFGQTATVRVHVPYIPELEGMIFDNLARKQRQFDEDTAQMECQYRAALGRERTAS